MSGYLDYSGRDDVLSGGVRKIGVNTPAGRFAVRLPDNILRIWRLPG